MKQLLIDLRDKVRDLTRENTNLRGSISESGAELAQMVMKGRQVEQSLLLKLAEKDVQLAAVGERIKRLEKERVVLMLAILACLCVCVGMLIK